MSKPEIQTLAVYGNGGGGSNCASMLETVKPIEGLAQLKIAYFDTSRANAENLPEDRFFLVDTGDSTEGSGMERRSNARPILDQVNKFLLEHPPGNLNVVVYTASGGSGSVSGPAIHSELLKRGLPVISVVIGDSSSEKGLINHMDVIEGFEYVSRNREANFVYAYCYNEGNKSWASVNNEVMRIITALAVLSSGKNTALDSRDVAHWLQSCDVKDTNGESLYDPLPLRLRMVTSNRQKEFAELDVYSRISLLATTDAPEANWTSDFAKNGYCDLKEILNEDADALHFILTDENESILKGLQKKHDDMVRKKEARSKRRTSSSRDDIDDSGLAGIV